MWRLRICRIVNISSRTSARMNPSCLCCAEIRDFASKKSFLFQKVMRDLKVSCNVSRETMSKVYKAHNFIYNDLKQSGYINGDPLKGVPASFRTTERLLGVENADENFETYYLCANYHQHSPDDLLKRDRNNKVVLRGPAECKQMHFGKTCNAEIFKKSLNGKLKPLRVMAYRGIERGLFSLLQKDWFVEGLTHHKRLPEPRDKIHYDVFFSQRQKDFNRFLDSEGTINIVFEPSLDW